MKNLRYPGAALLCLPLAVMAQTNATDPAAAVPDLLYRSVFVDTPRGVATESLAWRDANAEVAKNLRGHIDILKWEAAQTQTQTPAQELTVPAGSASRPGAARP